ncbi:unnamed protein product [Chrysoparadoxa australica]
MPGRKEASQAMEDTIHLKSVLDFDKENGQADLITSPRSLESCLRAGYDPSDLMPRSLEHFKVKGEASNLTQMRYEHAEQRRQERIATVIREREAIIEYMNHLDGHQTFARTGGAETGGVATINSDLEAEAARLRAGILEMEAKRTIAIKKRQEREMQRVIENEQQMADLQAKILRGEEEELARQKEHAKNVALARAAAVERKRQAELDKKKAEDAEDQRRREMNLREKNLELKLLEAEKKNAVELAKAAAERNQQRIAREEARQQMVVDLIAAQEARAQKSKEIMMEREARVAAQLEKKKRAKHKEVLEKRSRAERRIQEALAKNKKIQEDKRRAYYMKQEAAQAKAAEQAVLNTEYIQKKIVAEQKKEEFLRKRLENSYRDRADHRADIINRRVEKDKFYAVVKAEREKEMAVRMLKNELSQQDKKENIERIKRIDQFVKLQTMKRIEEETHRSEAVAEQRQYLIDQRKSAALQAMHQKYCIKEAMERMKATNKFHSLDAILDGSGKKRRKRPSRSASTPNIPAIVA